MRERLTLAFVLLAVAVLLGAGVVRSFTLQDLMEQQETMHLQQEARLTLVLIEDQRRTGKPVDQAFLARITSPTSRTEYIADGEQPVVTEGSSYEGAGDSELDLSVEETGDGGTVVVSESRDVVKTILGRDLAPLLTLFSLISLFAALAGILAARLLSAPFRKLAVAARALGRGRFDLDLPNTRIPEARAIGEALRSSAAHLKVRLSQEQAFAEHASHVLRTPLTGLRMELEELTLRDDVPEDAKQSAARCIAGVDQVSARAGELVAIARQATLVEGAAVPLRELATQVAQRWTDRLADRRRKLTAAVEGDLDMLCTPGPVEHLLDLVLTDVLASGRGQVRMKFEGEPTHIRISLPCGIIGEQGRKGEESGAGVAQSRAMAESLGGRMTGDGITEDIEILLPNR